MCAQEDNRDGSTLATEADRAAFQAFMSYRCGLVQAHIAAFTKYASLALQGAFLLNGSVGFAAFAQRSEGVSSLVACAAGALAAIVSAGIAYLAQRFYLAEDLLFCRRDARRYFGLTDLESALYSKAKIKSRIALWLSAVFGLLSLVLFVCGLHQMLCTNS